MAWILIIDLFDDRGSNILRARPNKKNLIISGRKSPTHGRSTGQVGSNFSSWPEPGPHVHFIVYSKIAKKKFSDRAQTKKKNPGQRNLRPGPVHKIRGQAKIHWA